VYTFVAGQRVASVFTSVGCLLVRQSQIVLVGLLALLALKDAFGGPAAIARTVFGRAMFGTAAGSCLCAVCHFPVWNGGRVPLCRPHVLQTSTLGWNALLFRSHQSPAVERAQLVWMCALSLSLHWFQSTTIYLM
jgi:hypothetical protein